MYAVVLASGFATRLHPLTSTQSKALLPVGGKPLLTHVVEMIPKDIEVLVTTNKVFEREFRVWAVSNPRVRLLVENIERLEDCPGPIGSLEMIIKMMEIDEPLLVLACDNYFSDDLVPFISSFDGKNTLVASCYVDSFGEACWHGVPTVVNSRVTHFEEKPTPSPYILISPLCYIFPTRIFPLISNRDIMNRPPGNKMPRAGDLIAHLVDIGEEVYTHHFVETWKHLTNIESYYKLIGG